LDDLDDGRPDRSRLRPELRLMLEAAERAGTLSNDQLGVIKARAPPPNSVSPAIGICRTSCPRRSPSPSATPLSAAASIGAAAARRGRSCSCMAAAGWSAASTPTMAPPAPWQRPPAATCCRWSIARRRSSRFRPGSTMPRRRCAGSSPRAPASASRASASSSPATGAGANLAAALALRARAAGIRLGGQMLIYPATDLAHESASIARFAHGFFLSRATLRWYIANYLGGADPTHPEASPLLAPDLSGPLPHPAGHRRPRSAPRRRRRLRRPAGRSRQCGDVPRMARRHARLHDHGRGHACSAGTDRSDGVLGKAGVGVIHPPAYGTWAG
jgi:acetyl esterase